MSNILTQLMGGAPEQSNEPVFNPEGARPVEVAVTASDVLAETTAAIEQLRSAPTTHQERVVLPPTPGSHEQGYYHG
jgi:hypothetical protein